MQTGNNDFQKKANLALVVNTIFKNVEISRAGLSKELGLIRSTVSNLVQILSDLGVVEELNYSDSTSKGGRKGKLLGINGSLGVVAGVEASLYTFRFVLVNIRGELVYSSNRIRYEKKHNFKDFFLEIVNTVIKTAQRQDYNLIGISAGLSGIINSVDGLIIRSSEYGLKSFNFVSEIANKFEFPIIIENDSRSCAWGHLWENPESNTFYYLYSRAPEPGKTKSPGLGLGIVVDGKVHRGTHYSSGEFYTTNRELMNNRYEEMFERILTRELKTSEEVNREYEDVLSNLKSLVAVLDPEAIVVGAGWSDCFDLFKKSLLHSVGKENYQIFNCNIIPSSLGELEVALGAAYTFLKKLYSIPQVGIKVEYARISWEELFCS